MRLWSLHPKYLDQKGLVALWREGLLAKAVLEGKTKGYRNHSQLERFKAVPYPKFLINAYLHFVCDEADIRGYRFNRNKLMFLAKVNMTAIDVTSGQFEYEANWLQKKLETRDENMFTTNEKEGIIEPHPIFKVVDGDVEYWEKVK